MTEADEDAVAAYLAARPPVVRAALQRVYDVARSRVPEAVPGRSYGMAALLYRDTGLVAAVENARSLSVYPFSGRVVDGLRRELLGFETTSGSIHFTVEYPLPDVVLEHIVDARRAEVDKRR